MSDREQLALTSPPDHPVDLPIFKRPRTAWRAHVVRHDQVDSGALWFSSQPDGRFNLTAPNGTCYFAGDRQTALRERLGPRLAGAAFVRESLVAGVGVSQVDVPSGPPLADTLSEDAVRVPGLTREIATVVDYELTRQWAAYFHQCGTGGVRYSPRHTTWQLGASYAVFGPTGRGYLSNPPSTMSARQVAVEAGLTVVTDAPEYAQVNLITVIELGTDVELSVTKVDDPDAD